MQFTLEVLCLTNLRMLFERWLNAVATFSQGLG